MHVTAVVNQKGGCGKTTVAINLAAVLGETGERVLLIDMDPQGHASLGLGQSSTDLPGLYEVLHGARGLAEVAIPEVAPGVDLVPATISLAAAERSLAELPAPDLELARRTAALDGRYTHVVLDCPPALGLLSINALRAADQVLVPVEASLYALDGLERLKETVSLLEARSGTRPPLRLVLNMFDTRTRLARELLEAATTEPGLAPLTTRLRSSIRVREAAYHGRPLTVHAPRAPVTEDFRDLARELAAGVARGSRAGAGLREVVLPLPGLDGQDVRVAGEFNGWVPDNGVETRREGDRVSKVLRLPPGAYQYRLIIDGQWRQDPNNPRAVPNHLGGHNSVLQV